MTYDILLWFSKGWDWGMHFWKLKEGNIFIYTVFVLFFRLPSWITWWKTCMILVWHFTTWQIPYYLTDIITISYFVLWRLMLSCLVVFLPIYFIMSIIWCYYRPPSRWNVFMYIWFILLTDFLSDHISFWWARWWSVVSRFDISRKSFLRMFQ